MMHYGKIENMEKEVWFKDILINFGKDLKG